MTASEKRNTLFVGIDVHKDTHTAVGVSPFGEKIFEIKIGNYEKDFEMLSKKVSEVRGTFSPYYGLEDVHGYGERLAEYLYLEGNRVLHVPSILVDRQRQNNTHPEKNDSLDAYGVAEVMIKKTDKLPVYTITEESEKAKQIKDVSHDREYLVYERTRIKNNLHNVFHKIWNTEYKEKFKDPFSKKALLYWSKAKPKCDAFNLKTMKRKVKRLIAIMAEIKELEKDLKELMEGYTIQTASGCGIVIAAKIVAEVGDIARFDSPASLAKYAGCAPRECSSGKRNRHMKTRSGNRRLNCAFHHIALSQISKTGHPKAKEYFKRKISEGKSKSQALVCLRRQIVNIIWNMMKKKEVYRF